MKHLLIAVFFCFFCMSAGCIIVDDDASFTIYNDSHYVIEYIWLDDGWDEWDVLGSHEVLYPGDSVTVHDLDCGYYDVTVQDEYGWSCTLVDEYLCHDDRWVVDDITLEHCAK